MLSLKNSSHEDMNKTHDAYTTALEWAKQLKEGASSLLKFLP